MTTAAKNLLIDTSALAARIALASAIATLLCVFEWVDSRRSSCSDKA
jgi:hypothetical protein